VLFKADSAPVDLFPAPTTADFGPPGCLSESNPTQMNSTMNSSVATAGRRISSVSDWRRGHIIVHASGAEAVALVLTREHHPAAATRVRGVLHAP
jgi:hypothetical protein